MGYKELVMAEQDAVGAEIFEGAIDLLEQQGYTLESVVAPRRYPRTEGLPLWENVQDENGEAAQAQENAYILVMAKDFPSQLNINIRSHRCRDNEDGMYVLVESFMRVPEEHRDLETLAAMKRLVEKYEGWRMRTRLEEGGE